MGLDGVPCSFSDALLATTRRQWKMHYIQTYTTRAGIAGPSYDPTMMLLMGMWMSLTKNPMKPMMAKPIAVAMAIFWNSFLSGLVHLLTSLIESLVNCLAGSKNCIT